MLVGARLKPGRESDGEQYGGQRVGRKREAACYPSSKHDLLPVTCHVYPIPCSLSSSTFPDR